MKSKKRLFIIIIVIAAAASAVGLFFFRGTDKNDTEKKCVPVRPHRGDISFTITCTGTIEPRNRLEIRPAISGRVDRILVSEGQTVGAGQIVAWMSSEERAALIDAARAQGKDSVKYWEETYKPIPLLSPIAGTVIVRDIEPGQSVTPASAILVVSDRLIVRGVVDETDIGKVRNGQLARISLDAYPEVLETGTVSHISYESKIINNVTTYEVDILPRKVPAVFRSGMTANISIIQSEKKKILLLPMSAVDTNGTGASVSVIEKNTGETKKRKVKTGASDGTNIEIVSGIAEGETVCSDSNSFSIPVNNKLNSPFFPGPGREKKKK